MGAIHTYTAHTLSVLFNPGSGDRAADVDFVAKEGEKILLFNPQKPKEEEGPCT